MNTNYDVSNDSLSWSCCVCCWWSSWLPHNQWLMRERALCGITVITLASQSGLLLDLDFPHQQPPLLPESRTRFTAYSNSSSGTSTSSAA
ncbi:hypothetical protein ElyMa_001230500 [Elysia marginata]|uniref:Uncharacterized protein n=1 Tax=Elysia marginata TaxID=1093978 RepID=A0AAV4IAX8_9GAST|nr:hypothetical protein ElyMa_001230500 [Elysia marginata]